MTLQGKAAALRTLWTEGLISSVERSNKHSLFTRYTAQATEHVFSEAGVGAPRQSQALVVPQGSAAQGQGRSRRLCPAAPGTVALSGPQPMATGMQAGGGFTSQQTAN